MTDLTTDALKRLAADLEVEARAPRHGNGLAALFWNARSAALGLIALREADEWQPIDTAPRSELDDIIVFNGKIVQCGQWWEGGWVDSLSDWIEHQPTHWRPLPAPPTTATEDSHGE